MKKQAMWLLGALVVGCGGPSFEGSVDSMGADAANEASEVDAGQPVTERDARADMQAVDSEASAPFESSVDGGADGAAQEASTDDAKSDADNGDDAPTCPPEEVYPQPSPTCAKWIATTAWPLEKPCCRQETHTCGHRVTFSPFCAILH